MADKFAPFQTLIIQVFSDIPNYPSVQPFLVKQKCGRNLAGGLKSYQDSNWDQIFSMSKQ